MRRAFCAFLGREATVAEAVDLAALFCPWIPELVADPDFPSMPMVAARVAPFVCEPISSCEAELLGGARLEFPPVAGARRFTPRTTRSCPCRCPIET